MAIKEIGTGVYPWIPNQERGCQRLQVGRDVADQLAGRLVPPFADTSTPRFMVFLQPLLYDTENAASALGIFVYPQLKTSPTDATNPGLVWGVDWEVWGYVSKVDAPTTPFPFGVPKPSVSAGYINAQSDLSIVGYEGFTGGNLSPEPGTERFYGTTGAKWLGLALCVRSGAMGGDTTALNNLRAVVRLTGYSSASS
jgi:hypothetical protein